MEQQSEVGPDGNEEQVSGQDTETEATKSIRTSLIVALRTPA
jgi:hypothetical protein